MIKVIKISLFSLLLIFCCAKAHSQKNRTNFNVGFGSYQLNRYKEFQEQMVQHGIPLTGIRAVDMFPNYYNWKISQERFFNPNHSISLGYSYLYTGGRNSLADYSGSYTLDILANSSRMGIGYTYYIHDKAGDSRVNEFIGLNSGWGRSKFKLREEIQIVAITQQEMELDFFSDSFFLELVLGLAYDITTYLSVHLSAGYEYEKDARLKSNDSNKSTLSDLNYVNVTTNWSGFRFRAGIGMDLGTLYSKKKQ